MTELPEDECVRRCQRCERQVYDVHAMEGREAESFLAEHIGTKPPKLDLRRRSDGTLIESECPTGERRLRRTLYATLFGLACAAFCAVAIVLD
jgi:hypothetical protein